MDAFSERTVKEFLTLKGVDFVRIQWVDYCNMIVIRLVVAFLMLAFQSVSPQAVSLFHYIPNP